MTRPNRPTKPQKPPRRKRPEPAPTRKVAAVGAAGSIATVLMWLFGPELDPETALAVGTLVMTAVGYVVTDRDFS